MRFEGRGKAGAPWRKAFWGVLAFVVIGLLAPAISQAQPKVRITGTLEDTEGQPVGPAELVFVPADAQTTTGDKVLEVDEDGDFSHSFFPRGRFQIEIDSEELFLKSMHVVIKDGTGRVLNDQASDAHPDKGLPPIQLPSGARVRIDLVAAGQDVRRKLSQALKLQDVAEPLEKTREMFAQGDMEGVLEESAKVVEQHPDLGQVHYIRGVALQRLGRLEEAEQELRKAIELDTSQPGVHGALGMALMQQAKNMDASTAEAKELFAEAAASMKKELANSPEDVVLLTNRAVALKNAGKADQAIEALERLRQVTPEDERVYFQLAALYREKDMDEKAAEILEQAPGGGEQAASVLYNQAVDEYNDKNYEEALAILERVERKAPELHLVHHLRGYIHLVKGDTQKALESLETFVEKAPDDPNAERDRQVIEQLSKSAGGSG